MTFSLFSDVITGPSVLSWLDQTYFLTLVPEPTNIWKSNMNVYLTVCIPSFSLTHTKHCLMLLAIEFPLNSSDSSTTQNIKYLKCIILSGGTD